MGLCERATETHPLLWVSGTIPTAVTDYLRNSCAFYERGDMLGCSQYPVFARFVKAGLNRKMAPGSASLRPGVSYPVITVCE